MRRRSSPLPASKLRTISLDLPWHPDIGGAIPCRVIMSGVPLQVLIHAQSPSVDERIAAFGALLSGEDWSAGPAWDIVAGCCALFGVLAVHPDFELEAEFRAIDGVQEYGDAVLRELIDAGFSEPDFGVILHLPYMIAGGPVTIADAKAASDFTQHLADPNGSMPSGAHDHGAEILAGSGS